MRRRQAGSILGIDDATALTDVAAGDVTDETSTGRRPPKVRLVQIDLDEPVEDVPTAGAMWLHVTAVRRGRPLAVFTLAAPLDPLPAALVVDAVERHLVPVALLHRLEDAVREPEQPSLSDAAVVVCTRDRPDDLARCLDSLQLLDPAVPEVVVVDNGRDGATTRALVESRGMRYVHEPVAGLDRARNRGIVSTARSLLLFTDDDVVVDPTWAARMAAPFSDPLVVAAAGLVLPASLDPEERWEFERRAPFGRGLVRRVLDGATASPYRAASVGAGASMAFRREFLIAIGGFPEALDAGTPTQSGGDTYALARALHAGLRVVYEPSALAWHLHRDTPGALETVLRGYGTGTASYLWQMASDTHDPGALFDGGRWAASYFGRRLLRAAVRPHDRRGLRLAVAEVQGAVATLAAYPRSRRQAAARPPVLAPRRSGPQSDPAASSFRLLEQGSSPRDSNLAPEALPRLTVVVPTRGRRDRVVGLVRSLARQDYPPGRLQLVVCADGDLDGTVPALRRERLLVELDVVALASPSRDPSAGNGAAVARNAGAARATGDVLVFLDDDVEPLHDGVLRAHAAAHADALDGGPGCAAVGPLPPRPPARVRGTALIARNWWIDATRHVIEADRLTFTDLSSGNVSVAKRLFERVGGFTPMPRREDWEFGWRVQQAGAEIRPARDAGVTHVVEAGIRNKLLDRFREGAGDLALARRHPAALWALPLADRDSLRPAVRAVVEALAGRRSPVRALVAVAVPVLRAHEILGRREAFTALLGRFSRLCYWLGTASAATDAWDWRAVFAAARATDPEEGFDLASPGAGRAGPPASTLVAISEGGERLGTVPLHFGQVPWKPATFAARAAEAVRLPVMRRALSGCRA